jgi:hypothetical protein
VASAFSDWAYSAADLSASVRVGVLSAGATGTGRVFMLIFAASNEAENLIVLRFQPFAIGRGKGDYRE